MTLRSIVVDDEPAARELLVEILGKRPDIEVAGVFGDSRQAIAGIRKEKPDVVFLDIQMPGRDGFAILDALGEEAPPVIFVTAYDEYAVQAFDFAAIDYILKPLDEDRVYRSIDRAMSRARNGKSEPEPGAITRMISALRAHREDYLRYIPIKLKERVVLQKVDDMSWIEADGKYVRIHTGGDQHLIRRTMHSLENRLDPAKFLRVSRSAIVNIEHVAHLEPWSHGEWAIMMRNGHRVISTHGYRERLQRILRDR
ncbi:MAG TPA: LytTR family DNA-binding domain-containing protein [Gemmatimonadaceae bacterium]|nr:LytTR family DNA-binding domain-containing protein [Gemmatimonadaceae bacterium]